ncbi:DUF6525 family protein [Shimia marina]|uniref:Uncharacterized protein n=1 Tax=Shimia marina TaxID=321267 RepID=A0A0P1EUC1_9RHOB|nr:DUF6525 family protein [Shimia marina]CUH54054.1 hypothetical protein SHM7688_03524 [Shimia marina]SFE59172.1 hypothetical protein SAMN04488037_1122 [Shimia marina]
MARNLNSSLRGRRRGNPMQTYDALPPELRQWLSTAALPWSPASARGIWQKSGGRRDPARALRRLDEVEAATLRKDQVAIRDTI